MSVTLHTEPFRHYKIMNPATGKVTWNGAGGQRIQSVTDILDPDQGSLMNWAVGRTCVAAEVALRTFLPESQAVLARSVLDFPGLMACTGEMPDAVRDAKADLGTEAHAYLAARLIGDDELASSLPVEYGYRLAIDSFIDDHGPAPVVDAVGPRVERAVGSFEQAIAGTYDAQVKIYAPSGFGAHMVHRIDLKSSNSVYENAFAQLAGYERLAVHEHGEQPSHCLTVVHIDPMGGYEPTSISVGSAEHRDALDYFEAAVTIRRAGRRLRKLLR